MIRKELKNKKQHFVINVSVFDCSKVVDFDPSFQGASILAGTIQSRSDYWISKDEYEESGPNIIHKKLTQAE